MSLAETMPIASAEQVRAAVERARSAQPAWAARSPRQRAAVLERALAALLRDTDRYIEVLVRETGRPRLETMFMEIFPACDALSHWARRAPKLLADRTVSTHLLKNKKLVVAYQPLGVVGIITPWNGPFILALNPAAQALVAGNAVVIKPSEVTPRSSALVEDLFREAGLPDGLVQIVQGDGPTGAALCEAGVDKISFTGSVRTGRKVGETCGRNLVPCTLELGGKDPMVVCADADLDRAAAGAVFGAFLNVGQYCCSTERVYVVEAVAAAFIEKVALRTRKLRQGKSGEFDIGPMIWPRQLEIVERHVADAVEKGARVLTGGRRNRELGEWFYEPTVLTEVTHEMEIMREETFGPVLPIVRVRDEEEAVRLANDSSYGLSANLWTRDRKKALALARRIAAGSVCVNDCAVTYGITEAPFGGRKSSGVGQVNGEDGPRGYCHAQPIVLDRFGLKEERVWFPYTQAKERELSKVMRFIWGTPLRKLL
jgi:acyl-CoA reductase-like NAD-dependent aldehyde dehydrogenase